MSDTGYTPSVLRDVSHHGAWRDTVTPRGALHFHEVDGRLIRRWVPAQRRLTLEVWMGDGWAPYSDVDQVLRYGRRVSEAEAVKLLHSARALAGTGHLSDDEAHATLRDRRLRATSAVQR